MADLKMFYTRNEPLPVLGKPELNMLNKERFSSNHALTGVTSYSSSLALQRIPNLHWSVSVFGFLSL